PRTRAPPCWWARRGACGWWACSFLSVLVARMKPRAAGRNPGTPIPHFATLMRATIAAAQCRGPGGTARGRNHDESHRDRDAALRTCSGRRTTEKKAHRRPDKRCNHHRRIVAVCCPELGEFIQ